MGRRSKTTGNFISVVKAWSNFEPAIRERLLLNPVVHRNVALWVKNKSANVHINVILRRILGTVFAVEKTISLYILSVFVALVTQHAKPTRCIMLSSVTCLTLPYFLALSQKRHDFPKAKGLFNLKSMFSFSLQLLSENFPILRIIQRDTLINVYVVIHVKFPLFLSHFNET